jgi:hypothetical protein
MRRLTAVLAAALLAPALATAAASSAQAAAPASPADALKKQFKNNHGVKITEVHKTIASGDTLVAQNVKGTYQFGKSGVAYSDTTSQTKYDKTLLEFLEEEEETEGDAAAMIKLLTSPMRIIVLQKESYVSSPAMIEHLPAGKTWIKMPSPGIKPLSTSAGTINIFEPSTVKSLMGAVDRKAPGGVVGGARTTVYRGALTYGELFKASPSYRAQNGNKRPTGKAAKAEISWKLWLDSKNLPRRLVTSVTEGAAADAMTTTSDSRYAGWGTPVTLKAPPAELVADADDLTEEIPELPTIVNPTPLFTRR